MIPAFEPEFEQAGAWNQVHKIMQGLTRRLRAPGENVRSLALMYVYGRVARLLLELAVGQVGFFCLRFSPYTDTETCRLDFRVRHQTDIRI